LIRWGDAVVLLIIETRPVAGRRRWDLCWWCGPAGAWCGPCRLASPRWPGCAT